MKLSNILKEIQVQNIINRLPVKDGEHGNFNYKIYEQGGQRFVLTPSHLEPGHYITDVKFKEILDKYHIPYRIDTVNGIKEDWLLYVHSKYFYETK